LIDVTEARQYLGLIREHLSKRIEGQPPDGPMRWISKAYTALQQRARSSQLPEIKIRNSLQETTHKLRPGIILCLADLFELLTER
jgi:hypothetical protein